MEQSNSQYLFMTDEQIAEYKRKQADMHDRLMAAIPKQKSDKEQIEELRAELAKEREKAETRKLALDAAVSSSCVLAAERDRLAELCRDAACQAETDADIIKSSGKEIHFLRERLAAEREKVASHKQPVLIVHQNEAGQISLKTPTGEAWDMSKFIGATLYAAPVVQPPCLWSCDDDENMPGTWDGACGAKWTFTDGGPIENDLRYCPQCGKPVIVEVIAAAEGEK